MTESPLCDESKYPDDGYIFSIIGKKKDLWNFFFQHLRETYPDVSSEWRYYHDGKSWLLKTTRKKKTLFWLSIVEGGFLISFYFTDKAREQIEAGAISQNVKDAHFNEKKCNIKYGGLRIDIKNRKDVQDAIEVLKIKILQK